MPNHSPAPWRWDPGRHSDRNLVSADRRLLLSCYFDRTVPIRHPDMQLIKAAPLLLEALQQADAWIREARAQGVKMPCEATLARNSAALAVAEGGAE